jgi:hypothetical protein
MRHFLWASLLAPAFIAACSNGSSGSSTSTTGSGASATTGSGTSGTTTATTGTSTTGATTGAGGGIATKRPYPDSSTSISILADQLPSGMTSGQQQFVVAHYVGTQKLTLANSQPLRALRPDFLVLHYHLAIWQSAPSVTFITDGMNWGNDYPMVDMHESWFWHNTSDQRVASTADGKLLMNLGDTGFRAYWESSLEQQVAAGDYDGIFFDSASPALLQGETNNDPRLAGTGAKDTPIAELGGKTYIQEWEDWIKPLNDSLAAKGIPLIPNVSAFTTTWDNTNYDLTAGIFCEGFADPGFATTDWKASTNQILKIANEGKIVILQNYLGATSDLAKRRYYLANYLLVKGKKTYLDYFAQGPFEWYPEWGIDLGAASKTATTVDDLLDQGVYRRDFAKGTVLVNPGGTAATVMLGASMKRVEPNGGGAVDAAGDTPGTIGTTAMTSIVVPANGAEILLF